MVCRRARGPTGMVCRRARGPRGWFVGVPEAHGDGSYIKSPVGILRRNLCGRLAYRLRYSEQYYVQLLSTLL